MKKIEKNIQAQKDILQMAHSSKIGKDQIIEWVKNIRDIKTILDIGAGSGTYYHLLTAESSKIRNAEWTAIEAWDPNVKKYNLEKIYNKVINQDVRKIDWNRLWGFDLAIMGDVLEHMSKDDAVQVVDNVMSQSKNAIISIPIIHWPQDEIEDNPFEVHVKDDWSHEEMMDTFGKYIVSFKKKKIGVYLLQQ